ncbi:MAG: TRAP transporter small permease subunit [Pseudomonadota bacterium]
MADLFLTLGTGLKWLGMLSTPLFLLPLAVLASPRRLAAPAAALSALIDRVSGAALWAAMGAALIMLFAQAAVVVARYVFGLSFSWLSELVVYGFASLFLLAAAATLRDDGHVRVDILRPRFGAVGRAGIDLAGAYLFIFPVCLLIFWSAISPSFVRAWVNFEGSRESDGLPLLFAFRTLVPAFAALLMAQGLSQALKAALVIRGARSEDSLHSQGGGA